MRVRFDGEGYHAISMFRIGQPVRLVRRIAVGNEDHALEAQAYAGLFCDEQVGIVDGIESAAQYSDFGFWILDFGFQ